MTPSLRPIVKLWMAGLLALGLIGPALVIAQDDPATPEPVAGDTASPVLSQPGELFVAAADAGGAVVTYALPAATDETDGPVPVACTPAPGTYFPLGRTLVTCTAQDLAGNQASVTFPVTVLDQSAPVITQPANVVVSTSDPAGAAVTYGVPAASDMIDGPVAAWCDIPSGSLFPVGATLVTCFAQDSAGNQAAPVAFSVVVELQQPEPTPTPEPEVTTEPTEEPTAEPTEEPDTETPASPTATSTPDESEDPGSEATPTPGDGETPASPTVEPTETSTPDGNASPAPTEPGGTSTPAPDSTGTATPGTGTDVTPSPSATVPAGSPTPEPVISTVEEAPAVELPDTAEPHRAGAGDGETEPQNVPAALELPWPLPSSFDLNYDGGPVTSLALIWGYLDFPLSQEFGHTAFSVSHASWYSYGTAYGLDGYQHTGLDVGMPAGTPLYSPVNGTVKIAGGVPFFTFYGNGQPGVGELLIVTDEGHEVVLGHMGRIAVSVGQRVEIGDFVGLSGGDNGDHLHLEVRQWVGGSLRIVDPRQSFLVGILDAATGVDSNRLSFAFSRRQSGPYSTESI